MVEYLDPGFDDGRVLPRIDVQGASSVTATAAPNLVGAVAQIEESTSVQNRGGGAYVGSALSQSVALAPVWPEPARKRSRAASAEADEEDEEEDEEDEEDESSDDEMALVERVQALEEQLELSTSTNDEKIDPNVAAGAQVVLNKGSLVRVLEQALHANDDALLEHCLGSTDKRVIEATVGGLAPHHVIPFLSRVVAKFEAATALRKTFDNVDPECH